MSQGCALLISRSKGQGHSALISQNGFQHKNVFPLHLWSRNFRHRIPMTQGCALSKPDTQKCRFRWSCTVYHFCGTSEAKHYIAITLSTVFWSVCLLSRFAFCWRHSYSLNTLFMAVLTQLWTLEVYYNSVKYISYCDRSLYHWSRSCATTLNRCVITVKAPSWSQSLLVLHYNKALVTRDDVRSKLQVFVSETTHWWHAMMNVL